MKRAVSLVASVFVWAQVARAADTISPSIPEISVPHAATPPAIDGKWGGQWSHAALVPLTAFWGGPKSSPEATEVRVCYDDRYLYVGFRCVDEDIVVTRTEPDDQTYRDDCVEVFLAKDSERLSDSVGLEINAAGVVADFYYRHSDWFNYSWTSSVEVKSTRTSNGYVLEMAIPWKTVLPGIGLAERGRTLRANFGRWDQRPGHEPSKDFQLWSNSGMSFPSPHRPERYGRLIFTGQTAPAR